MTGEGLAPPLTMDLGSRLVVWSSRAVFMAPVAPPAEDHWPVAGLYSSLNGPRRRMRYVAEERADAGPSVLC
jgi:hypothetical protein